MKHIILSLVAVVSLSACQMTQPSVKFDDFDNTTEQSTGINCSYADNLDKLCLELSVEYRGNYTKDQLDYMAKTMSKEQADKLVTARWLHISYHAENWLFVEKIVIKIDGQKYVLSGELTNRDVLYGGYIKEWKKIPVYKGTELYAFLKKGANGDFEGKDAVVRVYGSKYYRDFR